MSSAPAPRVIVGSTPSEVADKQQLAASLRACAVPDGELLDNLGLFLTRQNLARILFMKKLYEQILPVHGMVMEFGVRWDRTWPCSPPCAG